MKRPIMALLGRALSALPSFLRRSTAAIAVGAVLLVGVGMITGIIPNIIAALQAQSLAFRISSEKEVEEQTRENLTRTIEQRNASRLTAFANAEHGVLSSSILTSSAKVFPTSNLLDIIETTISAQCGEICTRSEIINVMNDKEFIILRNSYFSEQNYDRIQMLINLNDAFQLSKYGIDLVKFAKDHGKI